MISLKSYIPVLAADTGMTSEALYERQRALMRAGMLEATKGHGPGSGAKMTRESVATLVISILATDRLSAAAARTEAIATARPVDRARCILTRATTFAGALVALLGGTANTNLIAVTVSRTADLAEIEFFDEHGEHKLSRFSGANRDNSPIAVAARIDADRLAGITSGLNRALQSELVRPTKVSPEVAGWVRALKKASRAKR